MAALTTRTRVLLGLGVTALLVVGAVLGYRALMDDLFGPTPEEEAVGRYLAVLDQDEALRAHPPGARRVKGARQTDPCLGGSELPGVWAVYAFTGPEEEFSDFTTQALLRAGWRHSGGDPNGGSEIFVRDFEDFQAEAHVVTLDPGEYQVSGHVVSPGFC